MGGALKSGAPSYIERAADRELREALLRHEFCYVLTPRQMGKSSLMVRTANQLQQEGMLSVIIDLTGIGSTGVSVESWYLGQLKRIAESLSRVRLLILVGTTQLSQYGTEVLDLSRGSRSGQVPNPVVIFVDEIDTTLSLPYSDDYFAAIRALYNGRPVNPELERLTFVLLGVAAPSQLIKDPQRTPFNIGTRIDSLISSPKRPGRLPPDWHPIRSWQSNCFTRYCFGPADIPTLLRRLVCAWPNGRGHPGRHRMCP